MYKEVHEDCEVSESTTPKTHSPRVCQQLDVRRLLCPLPVIRVQQSIKTLQAGDHLEVMATDKGVLYDIPAWCRLNGHQILKITQINNEIRIEIAI